MRGSQQFRHRWAAPLAIGGLLAASFATVGAAGAVEAVGEGLVSPTGQVPYSCTGGMTNPTVHPSAWTVKGAPRTFYVNQAPQDLTVDVAHSFPSADIQKMRAGAGGIGQMEARITPQVNVDGTPVTVSPMSVGKQKLPDSGGTTRNFTGPLVTLPTQTTPGDVVIGVSQMDIWTEQWLAGGNVKSAGREFLYGCNAPGGTAVATFTVKSHSATTLQLAPLGGVHQGVAATATAIVTVDGGTPAGVVTFGVGDRTVEGTVNAEGKASVQLPTDLAAGDSTVTATFVPTDPVHYDGSVSNTANLKVKASVGTTTALSMPTTTLQPGEAGEINVLVTAGEGAPAGEVSVSIADRTLRATLDNGSASFSLPVLPMGVHQATAVYTPTPGMHAGSATANSTTVTVLGNSRVLLDDPVPVTDKDGARLTARVSSDAAETTGKVRFQVGGQTYEATVVDGVASTTVQALAAGTYTVQAEFVPALGLTLVSAVSDGKDLIVTPTTTGPTDPTDPTDPTGPSTPKPAAATTLKVLRDAGATRYGQRPRVVAVLGQPAAGAMTFTVAGRSTRVPVQAGQATLTLPVLDAGSHQVRAVFTPTDPKAWRTSSTATNVVVAKDKVTGRASSKRSRKGVVTGKVTLTASQRSTVSGAVKVTVSGKGVKKRTVRVPVVRGRATFRFARVAKRYSLRIVWAGTKNLAGTTLSVKGAR